MDFADVMYQVPYGIYRLGGDEEEGGTERRRSG